MQTSPNAPPSPTAAPWRGLLLAVVLFAMLQAAWVAARGSAAERLVIHQATVGVAVGLINLATPAVQARGQDSRILAAGGGINILSGCEGTEVLILLVATLAATRARWRDKLAGLLAGAALVFALNQLRVLALFYSFRHDRELFSQIHSFIGPLAMVVGTLLFYVAWAEWARRRDRQPG